MKAQEAKRKELTWKDFADEMDYSGLLNAIRNSKASKMTLIVRAFITIPKEDFEVEIEPIIASQHVVCFLFIVGSDYRLLLLNKSRLWHPKFMIHIRSNFKPFKLDGDVLCTTASFVINDMMKLRPQSMLNWIPKLYPIGLQLLLIKHALLISRLLLVDQSGTQFLIHVVAKVAV